MNEPEGSLSHLDAAGRARMVDVGGKGVTAREARARGWVSMSASTLELIAGGAVPKGDVAAVARIAGIMAAKRASGIIPLCHPIPLDFVSVELRPGRDGGGGPAIEVEAVVRATGRTGAEMEALAAVGAAALTVYDMCKSVERGMVIGGVRLVEKSGGRSGRYVREEDGGGGAPAGAAGGRSPDPGPRRLRAAVVTVSDSGARGERVDSSGPAAARAVERMGFAVETQTLVPDDEGAIASTLVRLADSGLDLVLTTGGTGLSPRDHTPEATRRVIEREVPGIPELMRLNGSLATPRAALSRAVAGVRGATLIVNLPGSPRAVEENLQSLAQVLPHALEVLRGEARECARLREGGPG